MKQVNLGYKVLITYKVVEQITIDTDIIDRHDAVDYAVDCLYQDVFLHKDYHLDIFNDILKIDVIENIVTVED